MKFNADCADLPDELIADQERGSVVFLCGAGVSQRVGLPSFQRLVEDIYRQLGERWEGHPAEEEAMVPAFGRALALDRAVFSLRRRLTAGDSKVSGEIGRKIVEAVTASLKPPEVDLADHYNILRLSRDAELRTRIVTTNFDTLFERAWLGRNDVPLSSRACADLPAPRSPDFEGVLHLHGRIADGQCDVHNLTRTDLVLDSAEFGQAYLRSGWAAQYVYDLARAATIVIVGYGADDPPMRYILEVLTADRTRFPDLKSIYAFAPSAPGEEARQRVREIWSAKGATAIAYDSQDPADHAMLYNTLAAWADFADDPTAWRKAQGERILAASPGDVSEDDWPILDWLMKAGDTSQMLSTVNPEPHWGPALARRGLLSSEDASASPWIVKRMTEPDMLEAVLEGIPVDQWSFRLMENELARNGGNWPKALRLAWHIVLAHLKRDPHGSDLDFYRASQSVRNGDVSLEVRRLIVKSLRPRIRPSAPFRLHGEAAEKEGAEHEPRLHDLLWLDFECSADPEIPQILENWPADQRASLLRSLMTALEEALEEAVEYGLVEVGFDRPSWDVPSVSKHPQNRHRHGFYPIIRAVADLWEKLAETDEATSKSFAVAWAVSPYLLVKRLAVHAMAFPSIFDGAEAADGLLSMSDADFWLSRARRETMRLMALRWADFPEDLRENLETRISQGPPRDLFREDAEPEQLASVIDRRIYEILMRLSGAGHRLGGEALRVLTDIQGRHPQWRAGEGDRDDFMSWSETSPHGPRGDIALLQGESAETLVPRAIELSQADPYEQTGLWFLFCRAEPGKALEGLIAHLGAGNVDVPSWHRFFSALHNIEAADLHEAIFEAVERPDFPIVDMTSPTLDWLIGKYESIGHNERLLAVWDRLLQAVAAKGQEITDEVRGDVRGSAHGAPEGQLARLLTLLLWKGRPEANSGLPVEFRTRFETLAGAEKALGFLGRASLAANIRYLHHVDPEWAEQHLVPWFDWGHPADSEACWSNALPGRVPNARLYRALKPSLLAAPRRSWEWIETNQMAHWLLQPLLLNLNPENETRYDLECADVRLVLAQGSAELRHACAHWLFRTQAKLDAENPVTTWRQYIKPMFEAAWPIEAGLRDAETSKRFVWMILSTGNAFEEAVTVVAPALLPFELYDMTSFLKLDGEGGRLFDRFPGAALCLLDAIVAEEDVPRDLGATLEHLERSDPEIARDRTFRKLKGWSRRRMA